MSEKKEDHGGGNGLAALWVVAIILIALFAFGVMDGILNWIRGMLFTFNMYMGVFLVLLGAILWFTRPKKKDDHAPH